MLLRKGLLLVVLISMVISSTKLEAQSMQCIDEAIFAVEKSVDVAEITDPCVQGLVAAHPDSIVYKYLIPKLDRNGWSEQSLNYHLDTLRRVESLTRIAFILRKEIKAWDMMMDPMVRFEPAKDALISKHSLSDLKLLQKLLQERLKERLPSQFTLYNYAYAEKDGIEGFYFETINDALSVPFYNDDRDLSFGARAEIFTDWLNLRFDPLLKEDAGDINSSSWLSVQSIFVGLEGYTPFLRSQNLFSSSSAVDSMDRPCASHQYIGFARYAINRKGSMKVNWEVKVGTIGGDLARRFQTMVHRDIIISANTRRGWEAQIANGGRASVNGRLNVEWQPLDQLRYFPSVTADARVGHDQTSLQAGLNLSNKSLARRGPVNLDFTKNKNYSMTVNNHTSFRYVLHNSMLEGYGILYRTPDEDLDSPRDSYYLERNSVKRLVMFNELSVTLSFKRVGFVLKQTLSSPEFEIVDKEGESLPEDRNRSKWHHYGTFGVLFKL